MQLHIKGDAKFYSNFFLRKKKQFSEAKLGVGFGGVVGKALLCSGLLTCKQNLSQKISKAMHTSHLR